MHTLKEIELSNIVIGMEFNENKWNIMHLVSMNENRNKINMIKVAYLACI